jgi:uncharacterized Zn finger protein
MQLEKPKINLRDMDFIVCDKCGHNEFKEITYLKRVPKLLTGSPDDTVVPFPTYACLACGHVNEELNPFHTESPKLEL